MEHVSLLLSGCRTQNRRKQELGNEMARQLALLSFVQWKMTLANLKKRENLLEGDRVTHRIEGIDAESGWEKDGLRTGQVSGKDCQGTTAGIDTLQDMFPAPTPSPSGFTDPGERGQLSKLGSYDQL